MRLTSLSIIFVIIAICLLLVINSKTEDLSAITKNKIEYNMIFDSATNDAVQRLVEIGTNRELLLNKDLALEKFMNSRYIQFGIADNIDIQNKLKIYLPVMAIVYTDGYYILSNEEYKDGSGITITEQIWKEKRPYISEDSMYIYCFTLTDNVKLIDKNNNEVYEGKVNDLRLELPLASFLSEDTFEITRKRAIIDCLKEDISYYISMNNKIANNFGIYYEFRLPDISDETWTRTIEDVSFIAVFQGYPYGVGGDVYTRVCISAARISKSSKYYIEVDLDHGITYYHRENCEELIERYTPYYSRKECALEGAWPCLECN